MKEKIERTGHSFAVEQLGQFDPSKKFSETGGVEYVFHGSFQKHVFDSVGTFIQFFILRFIEYVLVGVTSDQEIMKKFSISKESGLSTKKEILLTIYEFGQKYIEELIENDEYETIVGYLLCDDGLIRVVSIVYEKDNNKIYCYCRKPRFWLAKEKIMLKVQKV